MTKLSAAQRDGLLKAIKEATDDQFAKASQIEADAMAELAKLGVTLSECDRAAFRERVRPMWDRFAERTPGAKPLLDAIQQTANG
jgi:TRAP-type C4-dicarboxylate transport system substrate-binding protein